LRTFIINPQLLKEGTDLDRAVSLNYYRFIQYQSTSI